MLFCFNSWLSRYRWHPSYLVFSSTDFKTPSFFGGCKMAVNSNTDVNKFKFNFDKFCRQFSSQFFLSKFRRGIGSVIIVRIFLSYFLPSKFFFDPMAYEIWLFDENWVSTRARFHVSSSMFFSLFSKLPLSSMSSGLLFSWNPRDDFRVA